MTTEESAAATPLETDEFEEELLEPESPLASWRAMLRTFGVLGIGEALARALSFLAIIWMTRKLSLDSFGLVALGTNLVVWFSAMVSSSQTIGLRDAARDPERFKAITEPLLGVRLALAVVAMVALSITTIFVGENADDRKVLFLFVLVLPLLGLNLRFSVLAVGSAKAIAVGNVISQLVFSAGVFLLVTSPDDAIYVPLSQAASELTFALILVGVMAPRFGLIRPRIDRPVWVDNLKQSAPLMVAHTGRATITWYDSFLIAILLGQAQVGLYAAAYKPILFTTYAIGLLAIPFFAAFNAARSEQTRQMLLSRTVRLTASVSVPIAIVLSAGSVVIVSVLFGDTYSAAAVPLSILAWTIPLIAVSSAIGVVLISHRRQAVAMRHTLAGVALNIGANFIAVPVFGINGAAAVTLASVLLVASLNYRSCVRFGFTPSLGKLLRGQTLAPAEAAR